MKTNIPEIEYVVVGRDGVDDFKEYIMPHVYEQLFLSEDFEEDELIVIGAMINNIPLGAVVAEIYPNDEIFIHSIVVADNYQRMGIGTSFIKGLLDIGSDRFDSAWGENRELVRVFLHTQYIMPDKELEETESFLRGVGFTDFKSYEDAYIIRLSKTNVLKEKDIEVHSFETLKDKGKDIEDLFLSLGTEPIMDLCFYSGDEENPDYVVVMSQENDHIISVSSSKVNEKADIQDYAALIGYAIKKAIAKNPNAVLMVASDRNVYTELWAALANQAGVALRKHEAGYYALVEGGEN